MQLAQMLRVSDLHIRYAAQEHVVLAGLGKSVTEGWGSIAQSLVNKQACSLQEPHEARARPSKLKAPLSCTTSFRWHGLQYTNNP
jgi:uncharacterized coiled-coil protein SlyX